MIHKIVHKALNINAAKSYVPYQDLENKAMLVRFLEHPKDFIDSVRLYANSLTTQMIFGYRTTSTEDPRFKQFFHVSMPIQNDDIKLLIYSAGLREAVCSTDYTHGRILGPVPNPSQFTRPISPPSQIRKATS